MRCGRLIRFFRYPLPGGVARGGLALAVLMLAQAAAGQTPEAALATAPTAGVAVAPAAAGAWLPWWGWSATVFMVAVLIGLVAVPAGVGGGVLFVPIVGGLFPFHIDFVRGAGLLIALTGALASAPALLRHGLGNLRLALPLAFAASLGAIAGAHLGLALPDRLLQTMLGGLILVIVALMWRAGRAPAPLPVEAASAPWALAAGLGGRLAEPGGGPPLDWLPRRLLPAVAVFALIGVIAGVFGLGAGWANVPVLNLLMGVPLRAASGTSGLVLATTSPAALVYLGQGAVLIPIAVPGVLGMTVGATLGVRLLQRMPAAAIRRLVIVMLLAAAARALQRGLT
jgi:uncharacterized membrane protein YfcA